MEVALENAALEFSFLCFNYLLPNLVEGSVSLF